MLIIKYILAMILPCAPEKIRTLTKGFGSPCATHYTTDAFEGNRGIEPPK